MVSGCVSKACVLYCWILSRRHLPGTPFQFYRFFFLLRKCGGTNRWKCCPQIDGKQTQCSSVEHLRRSAHVRCWPKKWLVTLLRVFSNSTRTALFATPIPFYILVFHISHFLNIIHTIAAAVSIATLLSPVYTLSNKFNTTWNSFDSRAVLFFYYYYFLRTRQQLKRKNTPS